MLKKNEKKKSVNKYGSLDTPKEKANCHRQADGWKDRMINVKTVYQHTLWVFFFKKKKRIIQVQYLLQILGHIDSFPYTKK